MKIKLVGSAWNSYYNNAIGTGLSVVCSELSLKEYYFRGPGMWNFNDADHKIIIDKNYIGNNVDKIHAACLHNLQHLRTIRNIHDVEKISCILTQELL